MTEEAAKIAATILGAHHPYICVHTTTKGNCIKYIWDDATKRYDDQSQNQTIPCSNCKYFATKDQMLDLKEKGLILSVPANIE